MTKFTQKSFSVTGPGTKEYADNWERTFRGPVEKRPQICPTCGRLPYIASPLCESAYHDPERDKDRLLRGR